MGTEAPEGGPPRAAPDGVPVGVPDTALDGVPDGVNGFIRMGEEFRIFCNFCKYS